jgi:predicted PurR-regulated permease PerM
VLLGAALFGVVGAFLAVPVVAMMLALLDIYGKRYDLATDADLVGVPDVSQDPESQPAST